MVNYFSAPAHRIVFVTCVTTAQRNRRREAPAPRSVIVAVVLAFLCQLSLVVAQTKEPIKQSARHASVEIHFHDAAAGLFVPVTFGSTTYPFLVDTGQSVSSLDSSLRSLAGEERGQLGAETLLNNAELTLYDAPKQWTLRGVPLASVTRVIIEDLEPMRRVSGQDMRGVLGMDWLCRHVLELDSDHHKLRLLDKVPSECLATAPIEFADGSPYVVARFDSLYRERLLIDTGYCSAASVGLSPKALDKLIAASGKDAERGNTILTTGFGERRGGRTMRIRSLSIGDVTARELDIDEIGGDVLGLTFFSRFRTIFDFPNGTLYLLRGRRSAIPDRRDRSGLHIWRVSNRILVHSVDEGSAGAKAAIQAGDELLTIDGQDAPQLNLPKIRLLLRRENVVFHLVLKRGRKTLEVMLRQ